MLVVLIASVGLRCAGAPDCCHPVRAWRPVRRDRRASRTLLLSLNRHDGLSVVLPVIVMTFRGGGRLPESIDCSYYPDWDHRYNLELLIWPFRFGAASGSGRDLGGKAPASSPAAESPQVARTNRATQPLIFASGASNWKCLHLPAIGSARVTELRRPVIGRALPHHVLDLEDSLCSITGARRFRSRRCPGCDPADSVINKSGGRHASPPPTTRRGSLLYALRVSRGCPKRILSTDSASTQRYGPLRAQRYLCISRLQRTRARASL